jgi:lipooligosaccharide transport system ATP-binding protein
VVMDKGLIAAEGSPAELIKEWSTREVVELRFSPGPDGSPRPHAELAQAYARVAERVEVLPDRLLLYVDDGDATVARVNGLAPTVGQEPASLLVRRSSLEDVFLRLTGRSLVD